MQHCGNSTFNNPGSNTVSSNLYYSSTSVVSIQSAQTFDGSGTVIFQQSSTVEVQATTTFNVPVQVETASFTITATMTFTTTVTMSGSGIVLSSATAVVTFQATLATVSSSTVCSSGVSQRGKICPTAGGGGAKMSLLKKGSQKKFELTSCLKFLALDAFEHFLSEHLNRMPPIGIGVAEKDGSVVVPLWCAAISSETAVHIPHDFAVGVSRKHIPLKGKQLATEALLASL